MSTNTYDSVLYPSHSFAQTHPERLATLAMLFGMTPTPIEHCRVLELGCGDGGNLIPMAFNLPGSEFVGIDLAARPIALGQAVSGELELKNLRLFNMSIEDVSADLGRFDYIIAHGLYSWVPAALRDRILAIFRAHLSAQGVAYVSYNAYPGGHLRRIVRDMMLFHTRHFEDPQERIDQAKALLKFVVDSEVAPDAYMVALRSEAERVSRFRAAHLFHDDLSEVNESVYFHEFAEHASRHGMQYLAEADYSDMEDRSLPADAAASLKEFSPILKEQYADFLKCRRFRQTLLCHQEVSLTRTQQPRQLKDFYIAAPVKAVSPEPDVTSDTVEKFRIVKDDDLASDKPLVKAALLYLGQAWPCAVHFDELLAAARSQIGRSDEGTRGDDEGVLGGVLLNTYAAGAVELYTRPQNFVTEVSGRPCASQLARVQLRHGTVVTNQRHVNISISDELGQQLMQLLDGTRDRAALLNEVTAMIRTGVVNFPNNGSSLEIFENLPAGLDMSLKGLALNALLVA